jgi:hypothetical protein
VIRAALALLVVAAGAAGESGQDRPIATATLDATEAAVVGGRLRLVVEIQDSPGWVVNPPAEGLALDPFRIRSVAELSRENGRAWELTIVPLEAGDLEVPKVSFTVRGPGGTTGEIATEPVPVKVLSNLPPPEAPADGSAPAPPEAAPLKPALEAERNWWPVMAAAVVLALAAVAAFVLLRRLRARKPEPEEEVVPKKPLRPAWELALEELDRIAAAQYVQRGELDRQYVEVTETLRRYLENRYGVPALECTTSDLNELLRRAPVGTETSARLLSLLREADLVKFAKAAPLPEDARATDGRARRLVEETMPKIPPSTANEAGAAA